MKSRDIANIASGQVQPSWQDRVVAKEAKGVWNEIQMAKFEAAGLFNFSNCITDHVVALHARHKSLIQSADDIELAMDLARIRRTAVAQADNLQSQLLSDW